MTENFGQQQIRQRLSDAKQDELVQLIVECDGQRADGKMDWGEHYFAANHRIRRLENLLARRYHTERDLNRALHVADLESANKRLRAEIRMMQEAAERHNVEAFATGLIVHCTGCEAGAPFNADQLTEEKVRMVEGIAERLRTWWNNHQRRVSSAG